MSAIRKAGVEDIETIQQLAYETWPAAYGNIISAAQIKYMLNLIYSKPALTQQITELNHQFIIAHDGETPAGFASYSVKSEEEPHVFRLHKLYVLPGYQKKRHWSFIDRSYCLRH